MIKPRMTGWARHLAGALSTFNVSVVENPEGIFLLMLKFILE
jgi:hypothetical protein